MEVIGQRQLLLLFDEFEELEMRVASGKLEPTIFPSSLSAPIAWKPSVPTTGRSSSTSPCTSTSPFWMKGQPEP
jgi:hypothetical protein